MQDERCVAPRSTGFFSFSNETISAAMEVLRHAVEGSDTADHRVAAAIAVLDIAKTEGIPLTYWFGRANGLSDPPPLDFSNIYRKD